MLKKRSIIALVAIAATILFAAESCDDTSQSPESDSKQSYKTGAKIPVDRKVYEITGEVTGPVNDLTRQVKPAEGSYTGWNGYASGSYTGPVEKGKGFVRVLVSQSNVDIAPVGKVVILKTTDTKVKALLGGDVVTLKCRKQYEALAAAQEGEAFDKDAVATWELDYCRLAKPTIEVR